LVRAGTTCEDLVLNIDLAPTLLRLAGALVPESIQGQSWLAQLAGQPGRVNFLYEYFQEQGRVPTTLAVRSRRWKYITYPRPAGVKPDQPWHTDELYDLASDAHELHNRIADPGLQSTLARLRRDLQELQDATGFAFPGTSRTR
jgi:arylsulfatase A-like enzyme